MFSPKMVKQILQVSQNLPYVFHKSSSPTMSLKPQTELLASKNIELVWYDWKTIGFPHPLRHFSPPSFFANKNSSGYMLMDTSPIGEK